MRPLLARHSHDRTAPRPRAKQDCAPQGLKGMSCQKDGNNGRSYDSLSAFALCRDLVDIPYLIYILILRAFLPTTLKGFLRGPESPVVSNQIKSDSDWLQAPDWLRTLSYLGCSEASLIPALARATPRPQLQLGLTILSLIQASSQTLPSAPS